MKLYRRMTEADAFEMDQEWMIMNAEQCTVTKLSESGAVCWELLKEDQSMSSLVAGLQEIYDVTEEEAIRDIDSFLTEMIKAGLVQYAS
ncbi:PqqD family protein [Paenibacillus sp. y28]|uniref:PqqD family protein n=1 Tax=Paenibacillus sp. y28 TaxID=3129110 RepID=UPI003015F9B5